MTIPYLPSDLIAQNPPWRYADFEQQALQIAAQFQQQNIRSIALWLEDASHLACVLLAAWHAQTRVLFVPNLLPDSLAWANQNAQCWVVEGNDFPQVMEQNTVLAFTQLGCKNFSKNDRLLPLIDRHNQTEIWLKTSGSTGEAKTIVKTAEQMWLSGVASAQGLGFRPTNQITALSSVSIQHIYGLTIHIMMSLVLGWQLGRKQLCYPEYIVAESRKTAQNVLISSPAMLTRMDWQHSQLANNVGVVSSGGALPETVSQQIRQCLQQPVIEIYGSTETGPIASRADTGLWTAMPRAKLGCDPRGALWIDAEWTSKPEQTEDAVEFHDEQHFALLGRIDRIIKLGDKRTSLVQVEQDLLGHCWVNDCYIAQHSNQPRLAAWVELNEQGIQTLRDHGRKAVADQLKQWLATTQEKTVLPRSWRFTTKLPRNSQSKISRAEFEQICLHGETDPHWQILERTDNTIQLKAIVPLDLVYFKGHFAEFPLVPGAVELQWVLENINVFFGEEKNVIRVDNLKFQKFLRPNDEVFLVLKWDEIKQKVHFQLKVSGESCASGFVVVS